MRPYFGCKPFFEDFGERLLGVAGMILAPVVLNYIKREASQVKG